ncbi:MAG: hypothetical protein ABW074_02500, partial [Sedimenticola sp.]
YVQTLNDRFTNPSGEDLVTVQHQKAEETEEIPEASGETEAEAETVAETEEITIEPVEPGEQKRETV